MAAASYRPPPRVGGLQRARRTVCLATSGCQGCRAAVACIMSGPASFVSPLTLGTPAGGQGASGPTRALLHAPLNAPAVVATAQVTPRDRHFCPHHTPRCLTVPVLLLAAPPTLTSIFALTTQNNNTALASLATHNTAQLNPRASCRVSILQDPKISAR